MQSYIVTRLVEAAGLDFTALFADEIPPAAERDLRSLPERLNDKEGFPSGRE